MNNLYNTMNVRDKNLLKNTDINIKDHFWYKNPAILFKFDRLDEFFPSKDMTIEEQLNAIVRLSTYLSLGMVLYTYNTNYIYIAILTLIFTYFIYFYSERSPSNEQFTSNKSTNIVKPTQDNPFMNILPNEYINNPNREAISKLNCNKNPDLEKLMTKHFNYNLYRDSSDLYGRNTSQRQFYTMPVTTIPNEQNKLADWLYKTPPTCKENNGLSCVKNNYEHLKDSKIRNGIF